MKFKQSLTLIAVFVAFLFVMLPVCHADSINMIYDKNGNVVDKGDGFIRHYNSLNQLHKITDEVTGDTVQEFVYDPIEERVVVKKDYLNGETTYYFDEEHIRVENKDGLFDTEYVYHNGQQIAEIETPVLKSDLLSYYALDGNLYDSVRETTGINNNGATVVDGIVGSAYNFDGTGQYISVSSSPADFNVDPGDIRTYSVWFRTNNSETQYFLWKDGGCVGWSFRIEADGDAAFMFNVGDDYCSGMSYYTLTSAGMDYYDNNWHHAVGIVDRVNGYMKFYIDGILISERGVDITKRADGGSFRIGTNWDNSAPFDGYVDDVSIWGRELSGLEIKKMFESKVGVMAGEQTKFISSDHLGSSSIISDDDQGLIPQNNLVAYYSFDMDYTDTIGSNDATNLNAEIGHGLRFGSVHFDDSDMLVLDNPITMDKEGSALSWWMKPKDLDGDYLFTNTEGSSYNSHILFNYNNRKIYLESDSNCNEAYWNTNIADYGWHHYVLVFEDSKAYLYIDGVSQGESAGYNVDYCDNGNYINKLYADMTLSVIRGKGTYRSQMNGYMDEIVFYNDAINSEDIQNLYHYGKAIVESNVYDAYGSLIYGGEDTRYGYETKEQNIVDTIKSKKGLVAYFGFEDQDKLSFGNYDVSVSNLVRVSNGVIGDGLSFNASYAPVTIENNDVFNDETFSVSSWFKIESYPYNTGDSYFIVHKKHNGAPWRSWSLHISKWDSLNRVTFQIQDADNTTHYVRSDEGLDLDKWYHVVGTLDNEGTLQMYLDGELQQETDIANGIFESTANIYFGFDWSEGGLMDGSIDEFSFWNRALEANDVEQLYNYRGSVNLGTDFHFRNYDPNLGFFLQPDTVIPNKFDPQQLNRYMFERGNPYANTDKSGHAIGVIAILSIVAVVLAVAISAVNVMIKDFNRNYPADSASDNPSDDGSVAEDSIAAGASNGGTIAAEKIVESGGKKLAAKAASKAASKSIISASAKIAAGINLVGVALGIKDAKEALDIMHEYDNDEFNEKFLKYLNGEHKNKDSKLEVDALSNVIIPESTNGETAEIQPTITGEGVVIEPTITG